MKRIVAILLTVLLLAAALGCTNTAPQTPVATEAPAQPTEAPAAEPTEAPAEQPTDAPEEPEPSTFIFTDSV